MFTKKLHLISFNIPFPADYGGVIDVFYRIKALHAIGFQITLHCYEYGRAQSSELEKYCSEVIYYKRDKSIVHFFSRLPFIVKTRNNQSLLNNLLKDNAPVFFEGLHSCYFIDHPKLKDKIKIVRTHNIEHQYYFYLFKSEHSFFKKIFFLFESIKLYFFQKKLKHADRIIAISKDEADYFQKRFDKTAFISAFHPFEKLNVKMGKGNYYLYHGDLSVMENEKAVSFLIKNVFDSIPHKLMIAGKNPSDKLRKLAKSFSIDLIPNPSDEYLQNLISNAQAHVLPTFQSTGIKLKLLNVLYNGRFVLVNPDMVKNSSLKDLCLVLNSVDDWKNKIQEINNSEIDAETLSNREIILNVEFNNLHNAENLERFIYFA